MIYEPETRKVLLTSFSEAEGMRADNAGKATSELNDYWRTKTYVKPKDMLDPEWPIFPQPYQMAQSLFGGTWNDYNKAFIVQVAQCNLDCWYCFVDKKLRNGDESLSKWFTSYEVMAMWKKSGLPVCRISGGEPTLAPGFLIDMITHFEEHTCADAGLLWIDTNLSTGKIFPCEYSQSIAALEYHPNVALSGCFKGFSPDDCSAATGATLSLLDRQFEMAQAVIEETDLEIFFYVPGIIGTNDLDPKKTIKDFFNCLRETVDERAPLRTYILQVKNYNQTPVAEWLNWTHTLGGGMPIHEYWTQLCEEAYSPELLWLPNNQIEFKKREG